MSFVTRKTLKCIGLVMGLLGVCLAGFIVWYYFRTTSIVGEWSEPEVQILDYMHSANTDGSASLVDYFYNVSQSAQRKYPTTNWKGTAWQNTVTESVNRIAYGNDLAVVNMATGQITQHVFSNRGYKTNNDNKSLAMIVSGPNWVLVTPKCIYRITPTSSTVLLAAGINEKFMGVTKQRDADRAMVSCHGDRGVRCLSLVASTCVIKELYIINLYGTYSTWHIVYLSENPSQTVVEVDGGDSTPNENIGSGTLVLGINPADGMPLRILSPESLVKGATRYTWIYSNEKRQIMLRFLDEKSWLLDLDTLTTKPIEESDASGWHSSEEGDVSPLLRGYLTDHVRKTFIHKPGKKNFYAPVKGL